MKRFIDAIIYPLVLLLAALGLVSLGAGMTLAYALEEEPEPYSVPFLKT